MRSDVIRRVVITGFGLLALALAVRTAGAAEKPPATFSEVAEVTVVNLEVRVLDKKGRTVSGLTAEDFEIYEDGRRMILSNFYSVQDGVVVGRPETGVGDSASVPPRFVAPRSAPALSWVVYVDNDAVRSAGRARLLADLREYLSQDPQRLAQTTIVVRQGGGVRAVMPFGSDSAELLTALDAIEAMQTGGRDVDALRRNTYRQVQFHFESWHPLQGDPCVEGAPALESFARSYAAQMTDHLGHAVRGLRYLSTVLAAVPGRKAVLYFGEGLEQFPGYAMFHFLSEVCPQSAATFQQNLFVYDETDTLRAATDHANANRITFYGLQVSGLATSSIADASFADRRYTPSTSVDRLDSDNRQSSLFLLSDETGGKPVLNANRFLDALGDIETDLGTYYSLGFSPPHAGDNRRHAVSVKLLKKRPWRVRARRGYIDKALEVQLAERTFGAALFGFEENPLGITVEMLDAQRSGLEVAADLPAPSDRAHGGADVSVTLRLSVDRTRLTLVPSGDGRHNGRLRLVMTLDKADGKSIVLRQKTVDVVQAAEDDLQSPYQVDVGIDLAPGLAVVGVGVRDEIGGAQSFVRHEISIPPI